MSNITINMVMNNKGIFVKEPKWNVVAKKTKKRKHPLRWFWVLVGLVK